MDKLRFVTLLSLAQGSGTWGKQWTEVATFAPEATLDQVWDWVEKARSDAGAHVAEDLRIVLENENSPVGGKG